MMCEWTWYDAAEHCLDCYDTLQTLEGDVVRAARMIAERDAPAPCECADCGCDVPWSLTVWRAGTTWCPTCDAEWNAHYEAMMSRYDWTCGMRGEV